MIEYLHIDRSSMYKMINGKRNPSNKEWVDKIAYFFKLSPQEKQKYLKYACVGDTIYYHNNEIKDMIVIKGKESLNYYIQYLLEQELSQNNLKFII